MERPGRPSESRTTRPSTAPASCTSRTATSSAARGRACSASSPTAPPGSGTTATSCSRTAWPSARTAGTCTSSRRSPTACSESRSWRTARPGSARTSPRCPASGPTGSRSTPSGICTSGATSPARCSASTRTAMSRCCSASGPPTCWPTPRTSRSGGRPCSRRTSGGVTSPGSRSAWRGCRSRPEDGGDGDRAPRDHVGPRAGHRRPPGGRRGVRAGPAGGAGDVDGPLAPGVRRPAGGRAGQAVRPPVHRPPGPRAGRRPGLPRGARRAPRPGRPGGPGRLERRPERGELRVAGPPVGARHRRRGAGGRVPPGPPGTGGSDSAPDLGRGGGRRHGAAQARTVGSRARHPGGRGLRVPRGVRRARGGALRGRSRGVAPDGSRRAERAGVVGGHGAPVEPGVEPSRHARAHERGGRHRVLPPGVRVLELLPTAVPLPGGAFRCRARGCGRRAPGDAGGCGARGVRVQRGRGRGGRVRGVRRRRADPARRVLRGRRPARPPVGVDRSRRERGVRWVLPRYAPGGGRRIPPSPVRRVPGVPGRGRRPRPRVPQEPRGRRRDDRPTGLRVPGQPGAAARVMAVAKMALDGVRVLDFTQMMMGPWATQFLGDMGADVIKVERPGSGEWERGLRAMGELLAGQSPFFLAMNRNKQSLTLNLKDPRAREIVLKLAETSDLVVENFRPGVMDRLGVGVEALRAVNPSIVYVTGTGFGPDGPYVDRPGQDLLIQSMSGLAAYGGRRDDPPTPSGSSLVDASTALLLAFSAMVGLFHRERTGEGQRIDVSLYNTAIALQCQELAWAERDDVYRLIAARLPERPTAEWLDLLATRDVWCAPVQAFDEVVADPQVEHNELLATVEYPGVGELRVVGVPMRFSETPGTIRLGPPMVGQHTDEIMASVGYSPEQIRTLREEGCV